jgi:hypothetical protein
MVHALIVTRGLLHLNGVLADLRNDRFASLGTRHVPVYCLTGDQRLSAGRLKIKKPLADFRAADRAIREAVRRGLFRLGAIQTFEVRYYFDTPEILERAVARYWTYATLEDSTRRRLRVLARRHPRAQIVAISRQRLNVLVKS